LVTVSWETYLKAGHSAHQNRCVDEMGSAASGSTAPRTIATITITITKLNSFNFTNYVLDFFGFFGDFPQVGKGFPTDIPVIYSQYYVI